MEYLWYVIAALGAGIGTGLAGLSAATVMVPILIVLCPSFAGEAGAYQATAIALASDILGSAVTSSIYIKHKNIDLKRARLMMVCILSMCIAGSVAAWYVGNVVLGGFSLFLTLGIGIRFLIKPDTQRKETVESGAKLDAKAIAISLFFGLTIGFGTGFVGSGGGMMMLVVFTAFLGMRLKPAVGTSTFIMTFTALIASVSHILIEPSIVLERWDALIICIVVATLGSMVSARFANRVMSRTVGLVTGVVLTVLGAAMLLLNYWDVISRYVPLMETMRTFGVYLLFIISAAVALLVIHFTLRLPRELFRKMLHILALFSGVVLMRITSDWRAASLSALLFAALVYPALKLLERWEGYANLFVQRRPGEVKTSLLLLFVMFALLIAVCWGWLDMPYLATASILMWGLGDAAAALVGKRFGKHHIGLRIADHHKTWEGSCAMALVAFVVGAIVLILSAPYPAWAALLMALVSGIAAAFVEMITRNGHDTVTVPIAVAALMYLLMMLF
ncbi:TSUP family transporter [Eubacteriales bacterium OttesenSCG-928-N13]|nr:TSUP family transporter [Eubacteriales bacterium OttesenSCG-928-N13]